METVGVRDLKNNLSEYVRRASAGEIIIVTDRGRPVAELRQHTLETSDEMPLLYWEKVAKGELYPPTRPNHPDLYKPSGFPGMPAGTAQRLIDEDRDEGLR